MASYTLSPIWGAGAQLLDNNANPLTGGKVFIYGAGTTTPAVTYTTPTGSTQNSNPIVADAAGRLTNEIWFPVGAAFKFVLKNANDVLLATYDNIPSLPQPPISNDASSISYEPGYEVTAGNFTIGQTYRITNVGNTDFEAIGAADNAVGVFFTATGIGSGTGTASYSVTVQSKLREEISAKDFNAVGDGVTNDSAAFAGLEATYVGKAVNLLDGIYLVSSVPNGNNYYNGAFKVGSEIYWQNRNPRLHPFEGPATSVRHINPRIGIFAGLSSAVFPIAAGGMVLVYREANTHAVQNGSRVKAAWTDDGGRTIKKQSGSEDFNIPTISYTATADTRNYASGIIAGRFVLIATRREEPQTLSVYQDPLSIYSDDNGVTWTNAPITGLVDKAINFHGKVYPWPAGGANGAIVFDYRSGGIGALTSTDKGSTWTDIGIVVSTNATFPSLSEMSVAQIGSENKYVMVIRGSSVSNFAVATSANLTTWTAAADSGTLLKGNPPELMYADGKLFFVTVSRRNNAILPGYENALLVASANANEVYSSGGTDGWGGWNVVSQLGFWPSGYLTVCTVRGRYYALMTASEETAGGSTGRTAFLAMLSTDLVDVADTRTILEATPSENLIPNGNMAYWPNGTSFTTAATRTLILPDFTFARATGAANFTVSQVNGDFQRYAMRVQRDDGDIGTQNLALVHTLTQADSLNFGREREYLGLQFRCRKGSGFSAASGNLSVQVRYTDTASEQQVTSTSGLFSTTDLPVQSSSTAITPTIDWSDYYLAIGPVAAAATQLLIRWNYTPTGAALEDWFEIEQVTLTKGKLRSPAALRTYAQIVNTSLPFFWIGTVRSENGSRWISFPTVMHRVPDITVSAGTASNISTSGFELSHTSAADVVVTAQAWL
jgi:hypothetical protein